MLFIQWQDSMGLIFIDFSVGLLDMTLIWIIIIGFAYYVSICPEVMSASSLSIFVSEIEGVAALMGL